VTAAKRGAHAARRILVVDDSEAIRGQVAALLEERGFAVDTAADGRRAVALLESGAAPDLMILDVMMPGLDGLEVLRRLQQSHPALPVVMLSVTGRARTIVDAMRLGAWDYVNKPFDDEELLTVVDEVLLRAAREVPPSGEGPDPGSPISEALWSGESLARVRGVLEQIADTDVTVLIQGESGVGKEVVARAVHSTSSRADEPFVKVNCAALPGDLLESELFGHEKGAFTGAVSRKAGKFEVANGGTIFLDEIGEMSPAAQAKLLHVLQDGSFTRLGGNNEMLVDVRVVAATNRPLDEMVASRGFREDLFFRLNVVGILIPPLRDRREELPALIDHFLARYAARYQKPRPELSPQLLALFEQHPFPGNIRELENWMKRIVVLGSEVPILRELLARQPRRFPLLLAEIEEHAGEEPLREVARRASMEAEREAMEQVLFRTGWNRRQAARLLGVSYKTLLQKIRESGLQPI
jgi:two-component system response regulator AtoC